MYNMIKRCLLTILVLCVLVVSLGVAKSPSVSGSADQTIDSSASYSLERVVVVLTREVLLVSIGYNLYKYHNKKNRIAAAV